MMLGFIGMWEIIALAAVPVGLYIGAVVLRCGCWLFNKINKSVAGPDAVNAVPIPGVGKAMLITLVVSVANLLVAFAIGLAFGVAAGASASNAAGAARLAQIVSIPASLLVGAGLLTAMLPTRFTRALLVVLCEVLIGLALAVVIGIIVTIVMAIGGFSP
jgi:hypothetical protein